LERSADPKRPASRNDDRHAGKWYSILPIGSIVDDAEDGHANDSPMETTKRFPQGFGNLAKNARFPHSHSQDSWWGKREEQKTSGQRLDQQLKVSVAVS
jgi:hypothetical protein